MRWEEIIFCRLRSTLAGLAIAVVSIHVCLASEYHLAPGDTVEVAIAGLPDQHHRATIQLDGTIALPGIGSVSVAGLSLPDFQARMEALLPTKVLQYRTPDGHEHTLLPKPSDITTAVVEYRPVYITGDVLTPGQQAYRPQMTIRQLVAMAGGYSMLRSRAGIVTLDPIELRREYDSLALEFAKQYARTARLKAELQGKNTLEPPPKHLQLDPSVLSSIVQSEQNVLSTDLANEESERKFLQTAVKKATDQLAVLKQQEQNEQKGVEADQQELDRSIRLFNAGTLTNPRVTEDRRALLLSSTRRLQTTVELMNLERQRDDYKQQIERAASLRRIKLLEDLNEANVRLADVEFRIRAVSQKLQPGALASPAAMTGEGARVETMIVRRNGAKWDRIAAAEDSDIQPGDIVEVTMRAGLVTGGL